MARGAAACFGLDKIRCVAVDVEAHVSSVEPSDGFRLHGCTVHEHLYLLDGVNGSKTLARRQFH